MDSPKLFNRRRMAVQKIINRKKAGFTIIEVLIAMALFIFIGNSIYSVAIEIMETISRNQWRSDAVSILENEVEMVRNMNFEDIGVLGGYPSGVLLASSTTFVRGLDFQITRTVRNIDDPFDGTQGGTPNDTAPADYKLVEFKADCLSCSSSFPSITITTTAAPRHLETTTNNGSLFINVFDPYGVPISGANVRVVNHILSPTITINDETNANGVLQLVDLPTSTQAYEIYVSKNGYTSEQTYEPGAPENPNPIKPHSTVATQAITSISFQIGKVSTFNMQTSDIMCAPIPNVDFSMQGTKLIGAAPDVYKHLATLTTNENGILNKNDIEWDNYTFKNLDTNYDLAGSAPLSPLSVDLDSLVNLRWLMEPVNPAALLVVVQDAGGQLIDDSSVRLQGSGTSTDITLLTGRKDFSQTDWSGGQYSSKDLGIVTDSPAGEISLLAVGGEYPTSTINTLTSQTFDLGISTTTLYRISWEPISQPEGAGTNSLGLQIATNNDNSSWTFLGPDGTGNTYYTTSDSEINSIHNNNRYLRYKVSLQTNSAYYTPKLEHINFQFSSACVPDGQTFFNGLANGTYSITVEKAGFQTFSANNVSLSEDWQQYNVTLMP
jgi:type II secretory pathway pseudopilin PulG